MDIVIVGGGIVGTMHALFAVQRGDRVVHLEREDQARGASVRNFGLVWVSGRAPGADLDLALRARQLWEKVGTDVPEVGFRANGSLTIARTAAEVAVLEAVARADEGERRGVRVVDASEARRVNPAMRGEFIAALHCRHDAAVEPRKAARAIQSYLRGHARYTWLGGREVTGFGSHHAIDDHGDKHTGDLVIFTTGAWHRGLMAPHTAAVRRVRLQMLQTEPLDETLTTSIADGDSLRYYPAFDVPVRERLDPQVPIAREHHMQLLLVQRLDGSLTIGDTHEYTEPFGFDVDELPYAHLLETASRILGRPLPPVRRRWAGVYSQLRPEAARLYHRVDLAPGVVLVTGPGGRGMTFSPAIAEETLAPS
ncbi:TIGR03364 family FAD-dependent oxidoreductase [Pendulispora brunnea]|uniref:TIGR03364 family FAD-dependent oxidoreductase n=1 Tax=Pendulispora brunnea TaxID=2905690 RepID=A0ABZ2K1T3_9BACT